MTTAASNAPAWVAAIGIVVPASVSALSYTWTELRKRQDASREDVLEFLAATDALIQRYGAAHDRGRRDELDKLSRDFVLEAVSRYNTASDRLFLSTGRRAVNDVKVLQDTVRALEEASLQYPAATSDESYQDLTNKYARAKGKLLKRMRRKLWRRSIRQDVEARRGIN